MVISPKQARIGETIRQRIAKQILLIGSLGTSKTFGAAVAILSVAMQYPDSLIPVGRKNLSELKRGTLFSFREAAQEMGILPYVRENLQDLTWTISIPQADGSVKYSYLLFLELDHTKDRQFTKIKSINATCAMIDEEDGVIEDAHIALFSRTGRRNKNGAPDFILGTCNPNEAWIKERIYNPWHEPAEYGPLPEDIAVIEFSPEDSFLGPEYYERFANMPHNWKQRYLHNDWNYQDDENSLFKARTIDTLTISRLQKGERFIGVDPNAGGKDLAAIVLWEGDTIVDAELYSSEDLQKLAEPTERDPMNYGAILGRLTRAMMQREGVGYLNVGGDVIGVGQGWLTDMLAHGMKVSQFRSGDAPIPTPQEKARGIRPPYFDLRSQMYYQWGQDATNAQCFFYADLPHLSALKRELQLHSCDDTEKVMRVIPKDDLKLMLGHSPDIADAAMIGYWVRVIRHGRPSTAAAGNHTVSVGKTYESLYNAGNGL